MRELILIATLSLLATQTYAGGSRSLSLAASPPTEQPAAPPQATQAPAATPPVNVQTATTTQAPTPPATKPAAMPAQPATAPVVETPKPKHRELSTEARVIRELHRHGIYW